MPSLTWFLSTRHAPDSHLGSRGAEDRVLVLQGTSFRDAALAPCGPPPAQDAGTGADGEPPHRPTPGEDGGGGSRPPLHGARPQSSMCAPVMVEEPAADPAERDVAFAASNARRRCRRCGGLGG